MNLHQTVPELPVRSVVEAQEYYRDRLGFRIEWHHEAGRIGAVSHGQCAIFFREADGPIQSGTFWIHADDVDAAFGELSALGAEITNPIEDKPWGLRQFTVVDLHGNRFHFHHDL